jgi:hypothetical protein
MADQFAYEAIAVSGSGDGPYQVRHARLDPGTHRLVVQTLFQCDLPTQGQGTFADTLTAGALEHLANVLGMEPGLG